MVRSLQKQFLKPSDEFTPIPFWFWNDDLTEEEIIRQIHDFYEKGVMGFVLHPRIGIPENIVYLSKDFMGLVYKAVAEADRLGMYVILYDEGMYPSGSAKGMVVDGNPEYATRALKMVEHVCDGPTEISIELNRDETIVSVQAVEKTSKNEIKLDRIKVLREQNGKVHFNPPNNGHWSIVLFIETFSEGSIRGIHFGEDDGEENAPASADLLNPDAVAKFIRITHDTYYETLKEFFGNTVIAMFTDEPDLLGRNSIRGLRPWTTHFLIDFLNYGGKETDLPVLWFEAGSKTAAIRKRYRKAVNKRLTEAYYKQISDWCKDHKIALTGHPQASDDIGLLEYFQIPGQDVVWRWVAPEDGKAIEGTHSTAGKCSSDAARHRERRRNLNEVLGVCSREHPWDLSPGDKKWYLDWLFVRGVNLICPHAFYYSIDGKRRSHERPPDVGPNNHWWPFYNLFSDYMKRLSWLMTDSVNLTNIAVLCEEDHLPWKIVKPLFENQIEFNYLEEELFLYNSVIEGGKVKIAQQEYSVIIIEDVKTIGSEVIQKLNKFIHAGGHVIVCDRGETEVVKGAVMIEKESLITEAILDQFKQEVLLSPKDPSIRFSKVQKENAIFYFFVNEGEENYEGQFRLKEKGNLEKWDPWNGTIEEVPVHQEGDGLIAELVLNRRESIVYCVNVKEKPLVAEQFQSEVQERVIEISGEWRITNENLNINKYSDLELWSNWEGMEYLSETFIYENMFEWDSTENYTRLYLDLGDVFETAHVFINDQELGVKMWAPYQLKIEQTLLKNGLNTIKIFVTNSKANEMDKVSLPSGLVGPVTIRLVNQKE